MPRKKQPGSRSAYWRQLVREHEQSGLPVRRFCQQVEVNEHSFYNWRAKLRRQSGGERDEPVRFALVEPLVPPPGWALELVLSTGEHLRIGPGVEETALRVAIEALRRPVRP